MRSFVFYVVGLLGSVVIAPAVCPAEDSNRFSFPLPSSLAVGDHWTYSIVKTHLRYEDDLKFVGRILDTLSTETLTIRVVESLQIEDRTYFALSDGGLYRVDEEKRTWRYDTEAESEKIVWDIWGPLKRNFYVGQYRSIPSIEEPVIDGYACEYECLARYGPFVRRPHPDFEEVYGWIATIDAEPVGADAEIVGADTIRADWGIENFLYFPYIWTYNDVIKFPEWGITELYLFERRRIRTLVVAPNVGVVYYAFTSYSPSPRAGKVGRDYDYYPVDIEKTEWVLQDMQKGNPESTVVEDISFGALKQRMTRSTSKAP